jgi:hypothetical protein
MTRIILSAVLIVAANFAMAQGFMPWTEVMLEADADGDGMLSMGEVKAYKASDHFIGFQPFMIDHFKDCDTSGDDNVSMAELKKCTMEMGMSDSEVSTGFYRGFGFMPWNQ